MVMQTYSGFDYLCIDIANCFGLDKELFETRIQWTLDNIHQLEQLADQAETKPLYLKAVSAIRKAQKGIPTGHLVEFDACCSGIQVMSALTGCLAGATATGMIDPKVRADAYSKLRDVMAEILGGAVDVSRKDAKNALMTSFYGSKKEPKNIFGEDTPELTAFYQAAFQIAPGAWELLQDLVASWKPFALMHEWKLPDGFDARIKVMDKITTRIEVDELDHASFTYEYYVNQGKERGVSNVANVVHSMDAYLLRCIQRRCNYDRQVVEAAYDMICNELEARSVGAGEVEPMNGDTSYYVLQYERSGMADVVILPHLVKEQSVCQLDSMHLMELQAIIKTMLVHKPFPVITVHDAFRVHPNNVNHLRQHYANILADISESRILSDIMTQLYGVQCPNVKLHNNLGPMIRNSNYCLS